MITIKSILPSIVVLAILALGIAIAPAADEVNTDRTGLALGGYDPVAYFTEGKPAPGNFQITSEHDGAVYRFASKANRAAFQKSPQRYLPQYGGYCAYGVAKNAKFAADPTVWKIVDGKLYVNLDREIGGLFEKDLSGHIANADKNWPALKPKAAR